ncbi:unnamed protein product [Urochloa humidicola]
MVLDLNLPPDEGDGEGVPDVPEDDEDRREMHHVQGDDQIAVEGHGIGNQGLHPLDGIPVEEEIHPVMEDEMHDYNLYADLLQSNSTGKIKNTITQVCYNGLD